MDYMPKISQEQYNIIETLNEGCNINILAYAGAGKTTSILYIAKYFPSKKILIITYNSKLKLETRQRVERLQLKNIEVHSYHSFCVKYYDNHCFKDNTIMQICKEKKPPLRPFGYDIIIFDECQDMTPLYYELAQKIYSDNDIAPSQIITMGDLKQCIFGFNGADERYIQYAHILMNINSHPWKTCKLEISYRMTTTMADFLNVCVFNGGETIKSIKPTTFKPKYIICDYYKDSAFKEVEYYLNIGYKPDDIFILAPSIKSQNSPARKLENRIKQRLPDINVFVPTSDEETLNEDVLINKIVFSTIHQAKGLEREVVILFGFDASYFEFFGKKLNPALCPNELYVAATRAKSHLVLLHNKNSDFLPFLNQNQLRNYTQYIEQHKLKTTTRISKDADDKEVSPTELIRFLNDVVICECLSHLKITYADNVIKKIKIPLTVKDATKNTTENVADINGIAIPLYFELKMKNNIAIRDGLLYIMNTKAKYKIFNEDILQKPAADLTISDILYIANCLQTVETEYLFKICQINSYNWLNDVDIINKCMIRMESLGISHNAVFEKYINVSCRTIIKETILKGYIDCIDGCNVYEFKCVSKLENKHILQLAIYMYMIKTKKNNITDIIPDDAAIIDDNKYILYNILNNEKITIEATYSNLQKMINIIFMNKYGNKKKYNDDDFIKMNLLIKNKYQTEHQNILNLDVGDENKEDSETDENNYNYVGFESDADDTNEIDDMDNNDNNNNNTKNDYNYVDFESDSEDENSNKTDDNNNANNTNNTNNTNNINNNVETKQININTNIYYNINVYK